MAKDLAEKQQITIQVPYRETVSRLFIFRFLWMIPLIFIVWLWMIWMMFVMFFHFFYMLFLGKRNEWLWGQFTLFFVYTLQWNAYFHVLVDKRPGLFDFDLL